MRIVVTGATGNVGTALLRRLVSEPDIEVVGVARRPPPAGSAEAYDRVRWHATDLGDPGAVAALAGLLDGVTAVVHLAWQIQPSHRRERLRRTNVAGTRHLLAAMRQAGVSRLLYASSVGTYAPGPKDRLVDESHPHTGVPTSPYSVDKAAVEAILDEAERADPPLRAVRFRQALIFQHDAGAEIARLFLGPLAPVSLLRFRRLPLVPGHARLRAQAVHADDVADAYVKALRTDLVGAVNLAADPVLDADLLASRLRGRVVPVPLGALRGLAAATWRARLQPTDPGWLDLAASVPLMDCSRAAAELGWRPRFDALSALDDLLAGMAAGAGTPSPAMRAGR
ncbi:MAG TPA: NAD-dependent epimerase/dehydratase family protein, partial [Pilimelia sp.]|nr:NAD-dependent epimerase/dehydratase family protein [Pilimelia sp.]